MAILREADVICAQMISAGGDFLKSLGPFGGETVSGSGMGSRVSGFGFRVSGFRVSGFGFRVSGFGFRVSGFGFRAATSSSVGDSSAVRRCVPCVRVPEARQRVADTYEPR